MGVPSVDSFTSVRDVMEASEAFFASASDACANRLRRSYLEEERICLRFAARMVEELRRVLRDGRTHGDKVLLSQWIQHTPDAPVPADRDLERLRISGLRPDAATDELAKASQRWACVFDELSKHAPSERAAELFDTYRCVFESWSERLISASRRRLWD